MRTNSNRLAVATVLLISLACSDGTGATSPDGNPFITLTVNHDSWALTTPTVTLEGAVMTVYGVYQVPGTHGAYYFTLATDQFDGVGTYALPRQVSLIGRDTTIGGPSLPSYGTLAGHQGTLVITGYRTGDTTIVGSFHIQLHGMGGTNPDTVRDVAGEFRVRASP